ncbi:MAG: hypothetical protein JJ959_17360 [Nisaea sp.]|jgi:hypothetical protein|uniref:hypothetical protein n=1 Tax=Nisaea sp. TaxID=2024842 RepID=UPI001B010679|nr:hypothetical protein [Nisaea sp.]MBO6562317.1 hypothetical protein [Nisaea sp.]
MSDTSNTSGGGKGGQQPNIVIAPECQDIFVDGVIGAMVRDGVVRINLVNTRFNIDGSQVEHAVVSRMIMSRSGVRNLHAALEQLMGRLTRSADGRREEDHAASEED